MTDNGYEDMDSLRMLDADDGAFLGKMIAVLSKAQQKRAALALEQLLKVRSGLARQLPLRFADGYRAERCGPR